MSVLLLGLSHRTATIELLEQVALDQAGVSKLRRATLDSPHVSEALVLSTCNRVEIYAAVERFHGGIEDLTTIFADHSGVDADVWLPSIYVLYDEGAVAHLFSVAAGLDSMVIGESQVLGQVRDALRAGQDDESVGPLLNGLFQQALRVGKRVHSETDIDHAGQSMVSVALDAVQRERGPLAGQQVAIIGAGSMAGLAASTLRRLGVRDLTILNRSGPRRTTSGASALSADIAAQRLGLDALPAQLRTADLVVSCTGAVGAVVTEEMVRAATRGRARPLTIVDLALPRDVERGVAELDGVTVVGLVQIAERADDLPSEPAVDAVRQIVGTEVAAYKMVAEQASVAPTVVALRSMATTLVGAELDRLWNKLGSVSERDRAEIEQTVQRVADKLLHEPTVRVKQLGGQVPSASYAAALAELFALDPAAIKAVTDAGEAP